MVWKVRMVRVGLVIALAMLFGACRSASAQNAAAPAATSDRAAANPASQGCGPAAESFTVTKGPKAQADLRPEAGKALIYFVQDDRFFSKHPAPTIKWGVDGAWVGATQHRLYFRMTIEPGEHRLCAEWQVPDKISRSTIFGAATLHAKVGESYYYRAESLYRGPLSIATLSLLPVGRDEGALLDLQKGYSDFALKK